MAYFMILMCNGYQQLFAYCDSSHNIVLIAKKKQLTLNDTMIGKQFYNVPLRIRLSTTLAVLSVPRAFHLLGQ